MNRLTVAMISCGLLVLALTLTSSPEAAAAQERAPQAPAGQVRKDGSAPVTLKNATEAQRRAAEQPYLSQDPDDTPPAPGTGYWENNGWLVELLFLILLPIVGAITPVLGWAETTHFDAHFEFMGVSHSIFPISGPIVVGLLPWLITMGIYYVIAYGFLGGWPLVNVWEPVGRFFDVMFA